MKIQPRRFLSVLGWLLVSATTARTQSTGAIMGMVVDQSGGVIQGARVTVSDEARATRTTTAKPDGTFVVSALALGRYRVQAESYLFENAEATVTITETSTSPTVTLTLKVRGFGESVTVSAVTRTEQRAENLPASVSVVPATRVAETPGHALDDVLRTVPSIDLGRVSSYAQHPKSNNPSMRGLLSGVIPHMLVLVDGVPINDAFSGFVQWSRVPEDLVKQVEVVRGGGSTVWGTYATSGVVNIVTREPSDRELSADVGYGAFNTVRANGFASRRLTSAFTLAASGNWYDTAGFNAVPADQRRPLDVSNTFKTGNVSVQGNFTMNSTLSGFVRAQYFHERQRLGTPLAINQQDSGDVSSGVTKTLANGEIAVHGYMHDGRLATDNVGTPDRFETRFAEFVQNRHTSDATAFGASLQHARKVNALVPQLAFGVDFHRVDGTDTANIFADTSRQIRTDIGSGRQASIGSYALADVQPTSALDLLVSMRWDYWRNFDGFDGTTGLGAVPTKSADAISPRLGARYRLTPVFALRGAAYGAFNAPNIDVLYRAYSTPGFIGLPNSQLDPERSRGVEGGIDVGLSHTRLQVTAFSATIRDAITYRILDPSEPIFPRGYDAASLNINAGKVRSRGVEAEVTQIVGTTWVLDGGYTLADATTIENPLDASSVGEPLQGVPKHAANLGLAHEPAHGFGGTVRWRWTSTYAALFTGKPLEHAAIVDASAKYAWTARTALYIQIQNLFNRQYLADDNGFLAPQRGMPLNLFVGIRTRLN
jgi:outer membrane receptor protein involved in Fe transport